MIYSWTDQGHYSRTGGEGRYRAAIVAGAETPRWVKFLPTKTTVCVCVFWGKSVKTSITAHLSKRRFARGPLWQLHQRSFAFRSSTDAFVSRQSLELMPRSCTMGKVRSGLCGAKSPLLFAPCCWCCWMNHPNQLTPKGVQVCLTGYPMMIPFEWDCTLSCLWVDVECFGKIHECVKEREFNQRSTGEKELLQVEFLNIHDPI